MAADDIPPLVDPETMPGVDEGLLRAASAAIRNYCGWHIAPNITQTLTIDGHGGPILMLPTMRITDVESVAERIIFDRPARPVRAFEWSADGYLRKGGWWSTVLRGIEVTLTHGFAECPADIRAILERLVASGSGSAAGRLRQVGAVVYDFGGVASNVTDLPEGDRAILNTYRLPVLP